MDNFVTNETFIAHTDQDRKDFDSIHERMDTLATKDDIKQLQKFMERVDTGIGIFKFSWNNASKIGAFIMFIVSAYAVIRYGIAGALLWFFKLINGNHG